MSTCGRVPKPRDGFGGLHWHGIDGVRIISRAMGSDLWIMTVAILAAALAGALPLLPSALGGGPLYLLVSEWRNAHDFALHALYA